MIIWGEIASSFITPRKQQTSNRPKFVLILLQVGSYESWSEHNKRFNKQQLPSYTKHMVELRPQSVMVELCSHSYICNLGDL